MKNLILSLTVFLSFTVKSQITFEYSPPISFEKFRTSNQGEKFISNISPYNPGGTYVDTFMIYNSDWSIHKQVILPMGYSYQNFTTSLGGRVYSISDNLFNSDTLLEFLSAKPSNGYSTYSVINENGQILYTFPDSISGNPPYIYTINGNYKMWYSDFRFNTKIYSLPGSLPCSQCNSLTSGIVEPNQGGDISNFNVYPNPFNTSLNVEYRLTGKQDNPKLILTDIEGRELKVISLVGLTGKVSLNTSDLSKGTIVISLYNGGQTPLSHKVIKID